MSRRQGLRRRSQHGMLTGGIMFATRCCSLYKILVALADLWLLCSLINQQGSLNYDLESYISDLESEMLDFAEKFHRAEGRTLTHGTVHGAVGDGVSPLETLAIWRCFFQDRVTHTIASGDSEEELFAFKIRAINNPLMHMAVMYVPPPGNGNMGDAILNEATKLAMFLPDSFTLYLEQAKQMKMNMEESEAGYELLQGELRHFSRESSVHLIAHQFIALAKISYELVTFSLLLLCLWDTNTNNGSRLILLPWAGQLVTLSMWMYIRPQFPEEKRLSISEIYVRSAQWDFYGHRPMQTFLSFGITSECFAWTTKANPSNLCLWLCFWNLCECIVLHLSVAYYCYHKIFLFAQSRGLLRQDRESDQNVRVKSFLLCLVNWPLNRAKCLVNWPLNRAKCLLSTASQMFKKKEDPKILWFQACVEGKCDVLKDLIKRKAIQDSNVQSKKHHGDTALLLACRHGHLPVVQFLLDQKRQKVNPNLGFPLMIASKLGHISIVARLLRCDNLQLDQGCAETAIVEAMTNNYYQIAAMISKNMQQRRIRFKNERMTSLISRAFALARELECQNLSQMSMTEKQEKLRQYKDMVLSISKSKQVANKEDNQMSMKEDIHCYTDCKICFNPLCDKKIFACSEGHWLCGPCKNDIKRKNIYRCPECREDFAEHPPRRCHDGEKLVDYILRKTD